MRSMTAQARLQAWVLTLLPPAFIAMLSRIDPAFLHAAKDIPLTVQGIQIRIFAMPLGVAHIRTLRC